MSLPRHFEKEANEMLDASQSVRYGAFKLWMSMDTAPSAQDRFVAWQRHEMANPHEVMIGEAETMYKMAKEIMGLYLANPNKRGYIITPEGFAEASRAMWGMPLNHPHMIGNTLEKVILNCMFIGKYILACKDLLDEDAELETDCDLCLRPRKHPGHPDDLVVCDRCNKSWCGLCAEAMESESCPYCRKEW
jgi:hypothetical protein